jgi:hypothetical protein
MSETARNSELNWQFQIIWIWIPDHHIVEEYEEWSKMCISRCNWILYFDTIVHYNYIIWSWIKDHLAYSGFQVNKEIVETMKRTQANIAATTDLVGKIAASKIRVTGLDADTLALKADAAAVN